MLITLWLVWYWSVHVLVRTVAAACWSGVNVNSPDFSARYQTALPTLVHNLMSLVCAHDDSKGTITFEARSPSKKQLQAAAALLVDDVGP
jgi:hypothetical protein